MEVPLPTCFATLRKGVDGNNANDGYHKMGVVVLGRQYYSPDGIEDFEHHIPFFSKAVCSRARAGVNSQYCCATLQG